MVATTFYTGGERLQPRFRISLAGREVGTSDVCQGSKNQTAASFPRE